MWNEKMRGLFRLGQSSVSSAYLAILIFSKLLHLLVLCFYFSSKTKLSSPCAPELQKPRQALCWQAAYSSGRSLVWGLDSSPLPPSRYSHLAQLQWCPQGWAQLPNAGCPALSTGVREGKWVLLVCAEVPVISHVGLGSARRPCVKIQVVPACTTKGLPLCLEFGIGSSLKVPSNP